MTALPATDDLGIRLLMARTGISREDATVMWYAKELLEACKDALTAIANVVVLRGHESVVMRKHPAPCIGLDFCVMKDAMRRYETIKAAMMIESKDDAVGIPARTASHSVEP